MFNFSPLGKLYLVTWTSKFIWRK